MRLTPALQKGYIVYTAGPFARLIFAHLSPVLCRGIRSVSTLRLNALHSNHLLVAMRPAIGIFAQ